LSDQIENRSRKLVDMGVKPMDSLHLASAIEAKADYFCTCDDRFLKKAKLLDTEPTKVFSPLELALELNL
jgi:predicted nucleic acid-binding protein